jgi:hypothetical protein
MSQAEPLRVGVFDVDASPPVGSPLAYNRCDAVAMSLRAHGIVLLGSDQPIVLCAVDWIGIANDGYTQWRLSIAKAVGTDPHRVSIHTLHQHDAPVCDLSAEAILAGHGLSGLLFDVKFVQQTISRVASAAAAAKQGATIVTHVGIGQARVEKVASNRRILGGDGKVRATRYTACADPELRAEPEGIIDPQLKAISFWNEDKPTVVLTYFATHPQSYYLRGIANPDFPGMARFIRQVTLNGLPHVHFNGAGGNIGAGKYNDGTPDNRQVLAQRMANGMAAAWQASQRYSITSNDVQWRSRGIAIRPAPHLDEAKLLAILDDKSKTNVARGSAARDLAWLRRCQHDDKVDVSCLRIGKASILHLPGEAVVEYQLAAQQMRPDQFVAVAAYGDYGTGYICLEEHYGQGGYEDSPRASRVSPNTERIMKEAIRDVLH